MESNASAADIRFEDDQMRGLDYTIASWEGKEGFSQIAEHIVAIRCWSDRFPLPVARLQPATLELDCRCGPDKIIPRRIRGIVRKVAYDRDDRNRPVYTFHIVPRLWLLSQREATRVFYRQSVQDIISTVLAAHGIPFQIATTREPRTIAICTQDRETDLNFLMRLAEDHNIYFFFRSDVDLAVFADDSDALDAAFPQYEFRWRLPGDAGCSSEETVFEIEGARPQGPNAAVRYSQTRLPKNALIPDRIPFEPLHAQHVVTIRSSIRSAAVGVAFTLTGFPQPDSTTEYQIIRADHFYEDQQYHNRLRCLPSSIPYHPTPLPRRPSGFDRSRGGHERGDFTRQSPCVLSLPGLRHQSIMSGVRT